jgi:hypothetical protein
MAIWRSSSSIGQKIRTVKLNTGILSFNGDSRIILTHQFFNKTRFNFRTKPGV